MTKLLFVVAALVALSVASPVVQQPREIKCDGCKLGFWALEELIKSNSTAHEIEFILGQLCNLLPETSRVACHEIIDTGIIDLEDLIKIITEIETPDEICHQVGACLGPAPVPTPEVPCKVCEIVTKYIQKWLNEDKTVKEIEKLVDNVCQLFNNSAVCIKIADFGVEEVIKIIEGKTPHQACESLFICPSSTICLTCDVVFNALESWLSTNKTETEIEKLLEEFCLILPDSDRKVCDEIIVAGVVEAIKFLKEKESPYEACREIGACTGPAPKQKPCHECKYLLGNVQDWMADGMTPKQIDEELDDLCELLGDDYTTVCHELDGLTAEKLVAMLKAGVTPEQICVEINICPPPATSESN